MFLINAMGQIKIGIVIVKMDGEGMVVVMNKKQTPLEL